MTQAHPDHLITRRRQIQTLLASHRAVAVLANPTDIHYLTGFAFLVPEEREALLIISPTQTFLHYAHFTPVTTQPGLTLVPDFQANSLVTSLATCLENDRLTTVWLDEHHLTMSEGREVKTAGNQLPVEWSAWPEKHLNDQRMIKDTQELALMRQAAQIAAKVAEKIPGWLAPGLSEITLAQKIDQAMLLAGSDQPAFPTIVAFGAHAAAPHHQPGSTRLTAETVVLVDFGARVQGYRSDMTRSWWYGTKPEPAFVTIEKTVKQAYQTGLNWLQSQLHHHRPITAAELDQVVRDHITSAGFGKQFIHSSGHGIGLDIHESPSIFRTNPTPLQPGMVVTLEPGIYLPGQLGFRFENTLHLQEKAVVELT